jgi:FAD:protein FMN transferase
MRSTFDAMGTVVSLEVDDGPDGFDAQLALVAAAVVFEQLEARFSRWREGSEAARVRAGLPVVATSEAFREVYRAAMLWRLETEGAFEPQEPGGAIDLDGIVKALAIEQAGAALDRLGFERWSIAAGGDVLVRAEPSDPLRIVGVADPAGGLLAALALREGRRAVATSGISERGEHIRGRSDLVQVTVVADDVVTADVLATAMAASDRAGFDALCDRFPVDVLAVTADGGLLATEGIRRAAKPVGA